MRDSEKKYYLMEDTAESRMLLQSKSTCDKYDYLIAVTCGAIGGMIDIFLVGAPGDSVLGKWTDAQVDNAVKSFAKLAGWRPREGQEGSVSSAIGFLEKKFRVNYDQRYASDVGNAFNMSTRNHHMMSLAHSPDIIGLFFSVLNQFTSTSSFIVNGRIVTIKTDTFELQGGNFIAKLFCGAVNWIGHIMSDIAGSSGSRGNNGRGTGIVMPFYELFQFFKFGRFSVGKDKQDLATIALRAFQEGYDFRFGLAQAIPVIITDVLIRLMWSLRQYFQYNLSIKECIPTKKHSDLRMMLLFGQGTFCVMDGVDAGIRSGGNFLNFFMRLNLIAWFRFVMLVLKEICIRVGISDTMEESIESFRKINEVLSRYLDDLKKIDMEAFKIEKERYAQAIRIFAVAKTESSLNAMLLDMYDSAGLNKPWEGDFHEHMSNKNGTLVFK